MLLPEHTTFAKFQILYSCGWQIHLLAFVLLVVSNCQHQDGLTIDAISLHHIQLALATTCTNSTTLVATCVGFVALATCAFTPLHSHDLLHGT